MYGGKVFEITGTTNLGDLRTIYIMVRDTQGTPAVQGSTLARNGGFRFYVHSHSFKPGLYQVEVSSYGVISTQSIVVYP